MGISEELALFWKEDCDLRISALSCFHIKAGCLETFGNTWRFMGIYENSNSSQRCFTWELLYRVHGLSLGPWLCGGDFNEILYKFEKHDGCSKEPEMMRDFWQALDDC